MRARPPTLLALLLVPALARAEADLKLSGSIWSDMRYRVQERRRHDEPGGDVLLGRRFSRNENVLNTRLTATLGDKARGVADVDFSWIGFSDVPRLDALTLRQNIDPYRLRAHAAYVDVYDLAPHLDLRLGRQVVKWGSADQFNPTNNVNSYDFEDALLFGKSIANDMVRLDFAPHEKLTLTGVFVPVFRPAQLPGSAIVGLRSTERIPIQDATFRQDLAGLSAHLRMPPEVDVVTSQPNATIANSQGGLRLATKLDVFDVALSYYVGRSDLPQAYFVRQQDAEHVQVALFWPRMQAFGFETAASLPWLFDIGVWGEAALIVPQEVTMTVLGGLNQSMPTELLVAPGGHLCFAGANCPDASRRAVVVPSDPFVKWTVGTDYSFTPTLYANAQWVHGFVDEFGAGKDVRVAAPNARDERLLDRQGDYVVAGLDQHALSDTLLVRLFGIYALRDGSAVLFPQIVWTVYDATELTAGAFVMLGGFDTKFGDPAAGATEVFVKGKVYF